MLVLVLILAVLALLPPFFTRGDCMTEFEASSDAMAQARPQLSNFERAQSYLSSHALPYRQVSADLCPHWPGLGACEGGPTLLVDVPVKNSICRYYRSSSIQVQLGFDRHARLVHYQADMPPYHFVKLPVLGTEISWAK